MSAVASILPGANIISPQSWPRPAPNTHYTSTHQLTIMARLDTRVIIIREVEDHREQDNIEDHQEEDAAVNIDMGEAGMEWTVKIFVARLNCF